MPSFTHDTADDGFHEIQLSGKQLVFLFMVDDQCRRGAFFCAACWSAAAPAHRNGANRLPSAHRAVAARPGGAGRAAAIGTAAHPADAPATSQSPEGADLRRPKRCRTEASAAPAAKADESRPPAKPPASSPAAAPAGRRESPGAEGGPAPASEGDGRRGDSRDHGERPGIWVVQVIGR